MVEETGGAVHEAPRILLVDDLADNRYVVGELVRSGIPDARVITAEDAEQALEVAAREDLDAAIIDVQMPGVSGIELCRRLKATPATAHFPVLLLTAHETTPTLRAEGLLAGADDFVSRSMDSLELIARIRVLTRVRRAEARLTRANDRLHALLGERTRALWNQEDLYQSLVENAGVAILCLDSDLRITEWNRSAERILGLSRDDALGRRYADACPTWNGGTSAEEALNRVVRGESAPDVEASLCGPDGGRRVVRWTLTQLPGGKPGVLAVGHDATEQIRANEALRWEVAVNSAIAAASKSLLERDQTLVTSARLVLRSALSLTGSRHGYISEVDSEAGVNAAHTVTAMFADGCEVAPGETRFLFPRAEDGSYPGLAGHALNTLEGFYTNAPQSHPSSRGLAPGHVSIDQFLSAPAVLGDTAVGQLALANPGRPYTDHDLEAVEQLARLWAIALAHHRDRSKRIALEEQLRHTQKMEAVGRLAGGVAHDFNNLLMVINGNAELMLPYVQRDDNLQRSVEEIMDAGERAAALTRQLLAFSRKQVLQPRVLDLNEVVSGIEKMVRRLIGEDVELTTSLARDVPHVRVDPGQIEQVLMNLAVNARDAMPRGGRLIVQTGTVVLDERHVSAHRGVNPRGRYASLSVTDTGVGMDRRTMGRIFEPFFTTKEVGKGTGLGLSTVYGIVEQSGGFIEATSEVDVGTTFRIYLPTDEQPDGKDGALRARPALVRGTETVLLVEDERAVRTVLRQHLESVGYRVLVADGPREALALGDGHPGPIDLLLTDVVMPGMSGPELAERFTRQHTESRVLYVTGYSDDAVIEHGISLPACPQFLEKPFTRQTLVRKVRDVLDQAEPGMPERGRAEEVV